MMASGMDTTHVRRLGTEDSPRSNTAQYVAFNDTKGGLVMAMADMGIFTDHSLPQVWQDTVRSTKPSWLVVDGNWGEKDIKTWISAGNQHGAEVAFEPVSVEKSMRLFSAYRSQTPTLDVFPRANVDLVSPNALELSAMYSTAKENGYLDTMEWFRVIDALGMRGARERFVYLTSAELTDAGVPVQSVQLLPYLPNIVTKLGSGGVLLTSLLRRGDPLLFERDAQEFILARSVGEDTEVGGVYMRLFPPPETVDHVVSVNGAGDTLLGVLVSGLAQGGRVEKLVDVAQRGAAMTLRSADSVSPKLGILEGDLKQILQK